MASEERLIELTEELLAWTRFANREALTKAWRQILADPRHLIAYELSDGTRSQKEVGDGSGLSQPSVSNLWQRWRRLGIARDRAGRAVHIARPSDLGLEIPEKPTATTTTKATPGTQSSEGGTPNAEP